MTHPDHDYTGAFDTETENAIRFFARQEAARLLKEKEGRLGESIFPVFLTGQLELRHQRTPDGKSIMYSEIFIDGRSLAIFLDRYGWSGQRITVGIGPGEPQ